jgi:propionyl-CoA carboxylase alpha chain
MTEHAIEWFGGREGYRPATGHARVLAATPSEVTIEVDRISTRVDVTLGAPGSSGARDVFVDGPTGSAHLRALPRFIDPAEAVASGSLFAPMPGSVVSVAVASGEEVAAGAAVLVLEAMKMQHTITAPTDGIVSDLVSVGDQVAAGDVLAVVSTGSTNEDASSTNEDARSTDPGSTNTGPTKNGEENK